LHPNVAFLSKQIFAIPSSQIEIKRILSVALEFELVCNIVGLGSQTLILLSWSTRIDLTIFKLCATLQTKTMGSSLVIRHLPMKMNWASLSISKEDGSSCILVATIKVGIQFVLQNLPTFWYSHGIIFYFRAWVNFQINFTSL